MNLNHLFYFRTLAKTEHYGRAAQALYISQPSLSYAISLLEQELGTKLFEKNGRNISLTKYGRIFAQSVEKAFEQLEYGEDKLRMLTSAQTGHIELAYYHTLGVFFIPNLIKSFLRIEQFTGTSFSLYQSTSQETIAYLLDGRADIGFCSHIDKRKYPQIEMVPVNKEYFHVIVDREHPLAQCKTVSLKVLSEYPFVTFSKKSGLRPLIDSILDRWNIPHTIAYEAEQGSSVAGIVAAGLGISLLPEIPLPVMDICKIPIEEPIPPRITYLVTVQGRYLTDAVRNFKNYVIDNHRCDTD